MITQSPSIFNLSTALLSFQGAVDGVKRDSDNPFFKSKYADLEQVVDTARPHLQDAGIVFLQSPGLIRDGNLEMTTMLIHAATGEWIQGTGEIPLGKKDPQGAGSAQTYAQRYHLMAMLGLPPTDDDGEGAMERQPANRRPVAAEKPAGKASTYPGHLSAITMATDAELLRKAFEAAKGDKSLTSEEATNIIAAKDQRKKELTKPEVAPNFEGLQP